jgi:beta-lactamase class A
MKMKFLSSKTLSATSVLLIGLIMGWFFKSSNLLNKNATPVLVRENSSDYAFINPFIFSKISKDFYTEEYKNLTAHFNESINKSVSLGNAEDISVYFRDLNTGHWTGVNEDLKYEPGSLLKVVVMVGTLKHALLQPDILTEKLSYRSPLEETQYFKPRKTLQVGPQSVQNLLESMIVYSDNGAADTLLSNPQINNSFQSAYKTFLLPSISSPTTTDYMSPRGYSVVFRTLYDSTYLTWDLSNQALEFLSRTDFKNGLVAGIPSNIPVAHKFGEHTTESESGIALNKQLHDCGIIYYPNKPYLLCIMTRGQDYTKLENVIQELSSVAYTFVDALK